MQITERLSDRGATEAELLQLESRIGGSLPSDYRQFLSETNGGRPDPAVFQFATVEGPSDSRVRYFLTLDEAENLYCISEEIEAFQGRLLPGMLPIACDSFGNLVLLDVGSTSAGSVYFWDHEKEDMDEPTWDNMSLVAHSFSEFVSLLE